MHTVENSSLSQILFFDGYRTRRMRDRSSFLRYRNRSTDQRDLIRFELKKDRSGAAVRKRRERTKVSIRGNASSTCTKGTLVFYVRPASTLVFCARPVSSSSSSDASRHRNLDTSPVNSLFHRYLFSFRRSSLSSFLPVVLFFKISIHHYIVDSSGFSIQRRVVCEFETRASDITPL